MKALIKPYGQKGLKFITDAREPVPGPEDVLIKVLAASVCGTDLHIHKSDITIRDRVANNQIIGHEFCGEVVAVGDHVTTLAKGDLVSSESHIICGTCYYCLNGLSRLCQEVSLIGVDRPGGLAEYVVIPAANAFLKSPKISIEVASFLDAYGNAVDTALCVPLAAKSVLVTGCGPQGLMAIVIAIAAGARQVIATEPSESRRAMAETLRQIHTRSGERLQDLILDGSDPHLLGKIFRATDGLGVDVLLEMSGHPSAIANGLAVLRNGGQAAILGLPSGRIELDWASLIFKGITIHFRYGRDLYRTWFEGRHFLESGLVKLDALIHTPYFTLDQHEEAFKLLIEGKAAKIIFTPHPHSFPGTSA